RGAEPRARAVPRAGARGPPAFPPVRPPGGCGTAAARPSWRADGTGSTPGPAVPVAAVGRTRGGGPKGAWPSPPPRTTARGGAPPREQREAPAGAAGASSAPSDRSSPLLGGLGLLADGGAVRGAGGAGLVGPVRLTQRAVGQPLVPGPLPVAPAVVDLQLPVGADDDQRVAHVGVLVEPPGVLGAHVDAAVAEVGLPQRTGPRRGVRELAAVGEADRVVDVQLVVVGVPRRDADRGRVHDQVLVLLHGQVDARGGG